MVMMFVSTTTIGLGMGLVLFLRWRTSVRDRFVGPTLAFSEARDDGHSRAE